jgi:5-methylcytosine-specific restriction enzyme B
MNQHARIKFLYKSLIGDGQKTDWHKKYKKIHNEVNLLREELKDSALSEEKHHEFLRKLIFEKDNGIASRGQSNIGDGNFKKLIGNDVFLLSLKNYIEKPSYENFKTFKEAWEDTLPSRNPLLVNRVAGACTLDVSTTSDAGKFNDVFYWLQNEDLLEVPTDIPEDDWYLKNSCLMNYLFDIFDTELNEGETDKFYISIFVWALYEHISNPFSLHKQLIKYGAPGTGKTYQAKKQSEKFFDHWKSKFRTGSPSQYNHVGDVRQTVQFHPSFGYEDFIEGLRPVIENNATHLKLQNGVFKDFCIQAGRWELDFAKLLKRENLNLDWDKVTVAELVPYREHLDGEVWDFVFDVNNLNQLIKDVIPPFFFIIDEINRAELSRVLGELMYCLEYRGVAGSIKTQYANLNDESTGMFSTNNGFMFFIPTNVYLIGTMNTIDRSVESFDFALRRRFFWQEVMPDMDVLSDYLNSTSSRWSKLAESVEKLNHNISKQPLLGHDYQIGHAYFMNLKYPPKTPLRDVKAKLWHDRILPLLQEYLRGTGKENELIKSFADDFGM